VSFFKSSRVNQILLVSVHLIQHIYKSKNTKNLHQPKKLWMAYESL